jgi:hypothetical protein
MSELKKRVKAPKEEEIDTSAASTSEKKIEKEVSWFTKVDFFGNATQTAIITAIGTLLSQVISSYMKHSSSASVAFDVSKHVQLDWFEVQVMALISIVYMTPILLWFYGALGKVQIGGILGKLVVDQFIFSPVFTTGIIGLRLHFFNGVVLDKLPSMLMEIVPNALKSCVMFWLPVRMVVLLFVDEKYHLLVGNVCSLVWNVIFALILG